MKSEGPGGRPGGRARRSHLPFREVPIEVLFPRVRVGHIPTSHLPFREVPIEVTKCLTGISGLTSGFSHLPFREVPIEVASAEASSAASLLSHLPFREVPIEVHTRLRAHALQPYAHTSHSGRSPLK